MRVKRWWRECRSILGMLAVFASVTATLRGQETLLHSFNNNDGQQPIGGLIVDASGNLYGTTFYGGAHGAGTVYKLTPGTSGWTETVLHSFNDTGVDGFWPNDRVTMDGSGNLYGTTFFGGAFGVGIVFELSPGTGGGWTEKTLHNFSAGSGDGTYPHTSLVFDAAGNLYGTTAGGGANGYGAVFELSPTVGGVWNETVYSFSSTDGAGPYGALVFDAAGNLYGTTYNGGASTACLYGCGTVYELSPNAGGGWTQKVLHSFHKVDGANPPAGLTIDADGVLYGMTSQGGAYNYGTAFELRRRVDGSWREQTLHNFNANGRDGYNPSSAMILDAAGNLYGTTSTGGAHGRGMAFELVRNAQWGERILYSFSRNGGGGAFDPFSGLVFDAAGNLYGTAESGGAKGYGGVFEITP
jgi:uncharacterized repeat protein (TIGR03803 family)